MNEALKNDVSPRGGGDLRPQADRLSPEAAASAGGHFAGAKSDFPGLLNPDGSPWHYLDSAATSQKPLAVIEAMNDFYRTYNANVHRGIYEFSERSTDAYEAARAKVARFINAPEAREVMAAVVCVEGTSVPKLLWEGLQSRLARHRG